MLKSTTIILILAVTCAHSQFFYNYEEESDEPQTGGQVDPNQYNSQPSVSNEQYIQPSQPEANPPRGGRSRTHIRVRSNNYPPQTNNANDQPAEVDTQTVRQVRRQERRRQRQKVMDYMEPVTPPRVYGPSVFDRIGLGEPPVGVYVPQDSFLNALKSPANSYQPPLSPVPQRSNYVQPAVNYAIEPQQRFFVTPPPSLGNSNQQSYMLPVSRPQTAIATPSRQGVPQLQGRSVDSSRRNRSQRQRGEPVVDIDNYRDNMDDIGREDIQIMPKVEYVSAAANRGVAPIQRSRIVRIDSRPQTYGPSVFEKVGLGEAPNDVYVPEDSLLNVLRNPSAQRSVAVQNRYYNPQPTYNHATDDSMPETVDEEEYQPPARSTRRQSYQPPVVTVVRSTSQRQSNRRSSQQQRHSDPQEVTAVQQRQPSQRRRSENVEDFERKPRVQQQTRGRQTTVEASRPQPQVSSSRGSPFKEAKLAMAELPMDTDDDGIPGEAGTDYPTLHVIPKTSFSCSQQSYNGYYADLETSCQVMHLCQAGGVKNSFLCPNGTIFSQEKFSCQWWYKVNCKDAPKFYIKNDELYKIPERKERKRN